MTCSEQEESIDADLNLLTSSDNIGPKDIMRFTSTSEQAKKPKHLFDLPQELQDRIYRYALQQEKPIEFQIVQYEEMVQSEEWRARAKRPKLRGKHSIRVPVAEKRLQQSCTRETIEQPALAAVCKSLRHNVLCIYCRENELRITHGIPLQYQLQSIECILRNYVQHLGSMTIFTSLYDYKTWIGRQHFICYQALRVTAKLLHGGSMVITRHCVPASHAPKPTARTVYAPVLNGPACVCDLALAAANSLYAQGRDDRRLLEVAKACLTHQDQYRAKPKRGTDEAEVCDRCSLPYVGFRLDANGNPLAA